ncbi:carbohydrate ABC transporter permease [Paenibacillus beijingensis]|uniref:Sugar ABC transporter permease n=1 Tax=Paenibacillus beijingensis TaxID=1126833 RepID=A0A0D5NL02_9BACL|nr:carbohydrate ABC transporter permease [Paenibacillus beijingensis]AJY75941.1 sugar ABC transporter permease [Paenibacillus beijingensis]
MTLVQNTRKTVLFLLLSVMFVLYIVPFLLILLNSSKERLNVISSPLSLPAQFNLDSYINAFREMNFLSGFANSLLITVVSVVLIIVFSSTLAYYLVRWKSRTNNVILLTLVASMIVPFQALMIPFVTIYGGLNMLNSPWSLCFFYLGFGVSLATFMYHGFVKGVPKDLEQAAFVDGATRLQVFTRVVFPILAPVTTTIAILDVLWIWNDFLLPSLVLVSQDHRTLPLSTFYFFGTYTSNYNEAMAALVLSIIPIIAFYLAMQKKIINGVMEGAVK